MKWSGMTKNNHENEVGKEQLKHFSQSFSVFYKFLFLFWCSDVVFGGIRFIFVGFCDSENLYGLRFVVHRCTRMCRNHFSPFLIVVIGERVHGLGLGWMCANCGCMCERSFSLFGEMTNAFEATDVKRVRHLSNMQKRVTERITRQIYDLSSATIKYAETK